MPNYLNGKVYAIRSHQTEQVYIGSTVERLSARMCKHRCDYKRYKAGAMHYITSFKMLDFPDAYIELIEKHPCLCREELERIEGRYIRAEPTAVNRIIVGRTRAEYRQDHREEIKQYRLDNIEQIKTYQKEYYQDNLEQMKAYRKEYYQDNVEQIKAQQKQKHTCNCGGKYTHANKLSHFKSEKHRDHEAFMALTEEQVKGMLNP